MKKTDYIVLSIILSVVIKNNYAQNLVPNASFEIYSSCPTNYSQTNRATPWYDPTSGSSDYYNACDTGYMNVPFCGFGYQPAKTGVAYAGLWALNGFNDGDREYIQTQLTSPLVHDSCYYIEFYCNLDNNTGYSINQLGLYLSDTAIHYTGPGSISILHYTPQVVSTVFLTDTLNWMRINGYYQATGGEKFISIGDFKSFSNGDTLYTGNGSYPGAYYFIDDVSIIKVAGCDTVGVGIQEYENNNTFRLSPNPNNGNMLLDYTIAANEKGSIMIYDITGKLITNYQLNNSASLLTINNEQLTNGIYFYQIAINDKIVKSDKLVIIK